jgi:hypothetical protein
MYSLVFQKQMANYFSVLMTDGYEIKEGICMSARLT